HRLVRASPLEVATHAGVLVLLEATKDAVALEGSPYPGDRLVLGAGVEFDVCSGDSHAQVERSLRRQPLACDADRLGSVPGVALQQHLEVELQEIRLVENARCVGVRPDEKREDRRGSNRPDAMRVPLSELQRALNRERLAEQPLGLLSVGEPLPGELCSGLCDPCESGCVGDRSLRDGSEHCRIEVTDPRLVPEGPARRARALVSSTTSQGAGFPGSASSCFSASRAGPYLSNRVLNLSCAIAARRLRSGCPMRS